MASAMENVATNGQAGPVAVVQGGALAVPTLLGRSAPRIPVAGRIRAGIKVLTRRAAENDRVRTIYERGFRAGYEEAYRRAYSHFERRHDHGRCGDGYYAREVPRYRYSR